jgi:hypothetical protein
MRPRRAPVNSVGSLFLHDQFSALAVKLLADFKATRRITHGGTQGAVREAFVRAFLRRYIPRRFEIGSGLSIDSDGRQGKQIDIAIFDTWFAPTLFTSDDQHLIPVENLYAIIEVKSTLDATGLEQAVEHFAQIRKLRRVYFDSNLGFSRLKPEVLFALFAYDGLSLDSIVKHLRNAYARSPAHDQIHSVYLLGKGVAVRGASQGQTPYSSRSKKWESIPESFDGALYREWNGLAWTFLNLIEHLTVIADSRPRFSLDPYIPG